MAAPLRPIHLCANCEAPVTGAPVIHVGLAFCCAGCVAGGPCVCSYDERDLAALAVPVRAPLARSVPAPARLSSPAWISRRAPDGPSPRRRSNSSATASTRGS